MEPTGHARVAYSPREFAELFGKSQTWGYREIYRGNVTAITEHGRILIPAKEVERVLESAGIYNGREKPKEAKARVEKLSEDQANVWRRFVKLRQQHPEEHNKGSRKRHAPAPPPALPKWKGKAGDRRAFLGRIAGAWSKPKSG